jgi:hypothetical protein
MLTYYTCFSPTTKIGVLIIFKCDTQQSSYIVSVNLYYMKIEDLNSQHYELTAELTQAFN